MKTPLPLGKGPIVHIVGARPNFMKLAPVYTAMRDRVEQRIVHTGQHYDRQMSGEFFELLDLPDPDENLGVGSGSHAVQTAKVMEGLDRLFDEVIPAAVFVYGDVNSTLAATLVATKRAVPCLHVEAGLRSGDRSMPEELNRLATDRLSDLLFTHSLEANENLKSEGVQDWRIHFVGNVMIDSLDRMLPKAECLAPLESFNLPDRFALVTLHRPSNVDDPARLALLLDHLEELSKRLPVIFPVHPRTRARLDELGRGKSGGSMSLLDPVDYLRFIRLQKEAALVITDSGGIQEETTALGTPCLTLRSTTERPVTVEVGTNTLIGEDPQALAPVIDSILSGSYKAGQRPELWDGRAGERIADIVMQLRTN